MTVRTAAEISALVDAHYASRLRLWKVPVRIGSQVTHVTLHERDADKALERAKRWAHLQPWTVIEGGKAEEQNFEGAGAELAPPPGEILSTDATLDVDAPADGEAPIIIEGERVEDVAQHNVEAIAPEAIDDRAVAVTPPATRR